MQEPGLFGILAMIAAVFLNIFYFFTIPYITVLIIMALKKYLNDGTGKLQDKMVRLSLSQTLKEHRTNCNMTQEFVANSLGVSRQAVSKWENGSSDPSTSNLIALAKLYNTSAIDLLRNVENNTRVVQPSNPNL